jgi:YVTN family beta-propeller protein
MAVYAYFSRQGGTPMTTTRCPITCTAVFKCTALFAVAALFVCGSASRIHAETAAYVANGGVGTVSVIDVSTNVVIATVSLPAGSTPMDLAATPDGDRVYVTNTNIPGTVSVIDTVTNSVLVQAITVGSAPRGIAISSDGKFVYVANQFSDTVSVIDTTSNTVVATITVGLQPTGVGITPDGSRVYVASSLNGTVSVIDAATQAVIGGAISVGGNPQALTMSPDGSKVYVSNFNSASVSVIDTASNTVEATITVGWFPYGMATTPDGGRLYVADTDPALSNGSVAVIDTTTNTLLTRVTLPAFHTSRRVAVTPDGGTGYVTINTPQRVLVFDTTTNFVVGDPIPINGIPEGIAVTTVQTPCPPAVITGASASPSTLWPPNHRMVDVTVDYTVTSSCPTSCALDAASNEGPDAIGEGNTTADWIVINPNRVGLRAERAGIGNGRIYSVMIACTNSAGQSSTASITVTVPHDRRE